MALNCRSDHDMAQGTRAQTKSFSVQTSKVTYGGVDGAYYTSSSTRSKGSDGVISLLSSYHRFFISKILL